MNLFKIEVQHGGHFVSSPPSKYVNGQITTFMEDSDLWSYWECLDRVKELGYACIERVWYKIGGKGLEARLKQLIDDKGAMEMATISRCHGVVQVYLEHPVSEPVLVNYNEVGLADSDGLEVAKVKGNEEETDTNVLVEEDGGGDKSDDSACNIQFGDSEEELYDNDLFDKYNGSGIGGADGANNNDAGLESEKGVHNKGVNDSGDGISEFVTSFESERGVHTEGFNDNGHGSVVCTIALETWDESNMGVNHEKLQPIVPTRKRGRPKKTRPTPMLMKEIYI